MNLLLLSSAVSSPHNEEDISFTSMFARSSNLKHYDQPYMRTLGMTCVESQYCQMN